MSVMDINSKKPPVIYAIRIAQHWDGHLEYFLEDVEPNERSLESVAWALRKMSDALYAEARQGIRAADCTAETFSQSDIDGYIRHLAWWVWNSHYRDASPDFVLFSETLGVLTQLDNMLTGWNDTSTPSTHPQDMSKSAGEIDMNDEWRSMLYAPLDGTEIELLLHHPNRRYAKEADRENWEQIVRAKWIDFNGGGWTWEGMYGEPVGWRAAQGRKA